MAMFTPLQPAAIAIRAAHVDSKFKTSSLKRASHVPARAGLLRRAKHVCNSTEQKRASDDPNCHP
jgi:hypothetical protein